MTDFLNPYDVVQMHGSVLPHWQQGSAYIFVTWRLADALPADLLRQWKTERDTWMAIHPLPWNPQTSKECDECFPERMEAWLDRGAGRCQLREPRYRNIVSDALYHFDQERYALSSFVVMPNHVHVVFQPLAGNLIEDILHSWKSYTSKEIQKLTNERGSLWQRGYWDRLMRNQIHLDRCKRYVRENPMVARLAATSYTVFERVD
jgi:REP element-mobilizing transposase RayT